MSSTEENPSPQDQKLMDKHSLDFHNLVEMKNSFAFYDADNSGNINQNELALAMSRMGVF